MRLQRRRYCCRPQFGIRYAACSYLSTNYTWFCLHLPRNHISRLTFDCPTSRSNTPLLRLTISMSSALVSTKPWWILKRHLISVDIKRFGVLFNTLMELLLLLNIINAQSYKEYRAKTLSQIRYHLIKSCFKIDKKVMVVDIFQDLAQCEYLIPRFCDFFQSLTQYSHKCLIYNPEETYITVVGAYCGVSLFQDRTDNAEVPIMGMLSVCHIL